MLALQYISIKVLISFSQVLCLYAFQALDLFSFRVSPLSATFNGPWSLPIFLFLFSFPSWCYLSCISRVSPIFHCSDISVLATFTWSYARLFVVSLPLILTYSPTSCSACIPSTSVSKWSTVCWCVQAQPSNNGKVDVFIMLVQWVLSIQRENKMLWNINNRDSIRFSVLDLLSLSPLLLILLL